MGIGRHNLEHGAPGVGVVVPDVLPYWYIPTSILEHLHQGPMAQLEFLYDPGLPLQSHPEVTHPVPWVAHKDPIASSRGFDQGGPDF